MRFSLRTLLIGMLLGGPVLAIVWWYPMQAQAIIALGVVLFGILHLLEFCFPARQDEPTLLADRPGTPQPDTSLRRPALAERALALAKYIPVVLCGLLLVAWVVSCVTDFGVQVPMLGFRVVRVWGIYVTCGKVVTATGGDDESRLLAKLPSLYFVEWDRGWWQWQYSPELFIGMPILLLITLLLPLAIGPFNRFRFPLWSWFVFAALVAVELAFYLR